MKENNKGLKRFFKSFGYAWCGIKSSFKTEQNIIVMFIAGLLVTVLGFVFKLSNTEWLIVLLLIGFILSLEMMNTAIEATVNLHDENKKSKYGKIAKDSASAAVLIISFISIIIGLIIFLPKIIALF